MPKKTYKLEEIIRKLREAEVRLSQGASVAEVVRTLAITKSRITVSARSTAGGA